MFLFLTFVSVIFSSATGQTLVAESFVVVEGRDFTANCSYPNWNHSGIAVLVNDEDHGPVFASRVKSLIGTKQLNRFVFYNATRTDDGTNFSCSVQNFTGLRIKFGNGTISVIYPPEISGLNSSDQQVDVGSSFFLSLTVDAKPPVSNFSWTRKRLPYSLNVTSTSISIAAASLNDAGTYSLTVENIVNSTTVSFNLTVLCSPEFQSSSNPIHVNESDSFTISCCISSSCPFSTTITLRYDGRGSPLSSNPLNLSNSNCGQSFSNVQVTFTGNYTCEARNIHNRVATKVYNVSVMHKPGPVPAAVVVAVGLTVGATAAWIVIACILTCVFCPCFPWCMWFRSTCCSCCPEKYVCCGPYRYCDDDSIPIPHVEKQPVVQNYSKEKEMETGQPSYHESSGMSTGAMYQDPNTIQRQGIPTTGDLYAQPDKPARHQQKQQAMELPTYQDPSTIQHQAAGTGDMYALPDKNKIPKQPSGPAEVDMTNQTGTMYAELDHTGKPVVTRRPPPQQPQPVYSPVMGTPV